MGMQDFRFFIAAEIYYCDGNILLRRRYILETETIIETEIHHSR